VPQELDLFDADGPGRARRLAREVEALCAAWAESGGDEEARRRCGERLEALRTAWRREPALFGEGQITELRRLGEALRRTGRPSALEVLRGVFGHAGWRPGQEPIVEAVLSGRDCIGVMPTGAGKSLTYQIPARVLGGTTLVVSPLIALMKDQVDALARVGLRATFLNSSLAPEERRERARGVRRGAYELVYAAPEGLEASVGSALEGQRLSLIAVDEAHCISQWGHDFRPAYRNLRGLRARFGAPVLALTATATPAVARDIAEQLGMVQPLALRGEFFRPNLRLHAYKKGGEGAGGRAGVRTRDALLRLLGARRGQSGIVYCLSRKTADATAAFLRQHALRAQAYHAGLEAEARTRVQDAFLAGRAEVVVATVAFGMGIDKADVRFVVHRDMPRSIEGYYQEIGRAGRDGAPSDCVLLYSWADVAGWDRLAEGTDVPVAEVQRRQVREMFRLAEEPRCRHRSLVAHFGERIGPCGGSCDLCSGVDLLAEVAPGRGRRASRARPRQAGRRRG